MGKSRVEIHTDPETGLPKLFLDGADIGAQVNRVELIVGLGGDIRVSLRLPRVLPLGVSVDASVGVDASTAAALSRLGWTPPAADS